MIEMDTFHKWTDTVPEIVNSTQWHKFLVGFIVFMYVNLFTNKI